MDWEYNLLWNKSKLHVQVAHSQKKDSALFPLWCAISLETISRATLAFVHPSLLAGPTKGGNILYVFGYYKDPEPPKSIPIKSVFERLNKIVEKFTAKEYDICMNFMERRNRDLHSGGAAFDDFPTKLWLADYYRICSILLDFQKKKLSDWLPKNEIKVASEIIKKDHIKIEGHVKTLIKTHHDIYYKKTPEERKELRIKHKLSDTLYSLRFIYYDKTKCPSCKSEARIGGEISNMNEPYLENDEVVRQLSILPTQFNCPVCGLDLAGYDQIQAAGLGGYINKEQRFDPVEYYDFDPADYYEPDYGND